MNNKYSTRKISESFICALAILCLAVQGCDSDKQQKLQRKITRLQEEVSAHAQEHDEQTDMIGRHNAKLQKLENQIQRLETSLTRRIENVEKSSENNNEDGAEIDKLITQVTFIEQRIIRLDNQLQQINKRLTKLETATTQSSTQKNTNTPDLQEIEKTQQDLILAHNNLNVAVSQISEKVKNLDDCINSCLGDCKVSPLSWLLDLQQDVKKLKLGY